MAFKQFLFLQRRSPLTAGPEAFDLVLTAAAFDQLVRVILLDDGVYWLAAGLPDILIEAVERIGVERQSLQERGLGDFPLPACLELQERADLAEIIANADVVVGG